MYVLSLAAGVGFNASSYYITVDARYAINETVLTTMSNFLIYDDNFNIDTPIFYIAVEYFSISRTTGDIKIIHQLDPHSLFYVFVLLRFNGTITTTNTYYSSLASTLVQIYALG